MLPQKLPVGAQNPEGPLSLIIQSWKDVVEHACNHYIRKLRQKDQELETSLGSVARPCQTRKEKLKEFHLGLGYIGRVRLPVASSDRRSSCPESLRWCCMTFARQREQSVFIPLGAPID